MKIIKVGKYYALRHWFRWYWLHQEGGGADASGELPGANGIRHQGNRVDL